MTAAVPPPRTGSTGATSAPLIWRFANAAFDEAALQLKLDGAAVEIERRPLELLALLLRHAGEVVTKDEILDTLWPDRVVTEASLTKCMARLRQVLRDDEQKLIRTVHGYGYRLVAGVTIEEANRGARVLPASFDFDTDDPVPHRPNWKLVERLGTGGFGDAWLAEHTKTHERRVFKFGHDGIRLAALRREIALFRLLKDGLGPRDDIARIIDWNLEETPCFIEIEWSSEGNLADWTGPQGGPGAIPLGERLDLVAQVADALAAAHSMGVLHKDLKPANILIHRDESGRPRIRLSDFGSGRALDLSRLGALGITPFQTEPAGYGQQETSSGTPLYRAPELVAGGAATVQADIYSLGVILYQLVTGDLKRPLAPGWEHEITDELLREDIAAAAAGDPARRLGDAAELARRLRTLDARRGELARERATRAEAERTRRALELARARRIPLLALFCVLIVGLGVSSWLYLRAEAASRAARAEAARAQSVTRFLTDDLLSAANPFLAADPNITVKDMLAPAVANLAHRFKPDSLDRAAIEVAIGRAYDGLSVPGRALPLLNSALATRRHALGDAAPETQAARLAIAQMQARNLNYKASRAVAQQVLDIGRAAGNLDAESELRARYDVAYADCQAMGSSEQCIAPLKPLLAEAQRRLGPSSDLSLEIESVLAFSLGDAQHFAEAVPMARQALALTEAGYGPNHLSTLDRKFKLAEVLSESGKPDEAIALQKQVRASLLAVSGKENEATARAANQLAKAYVDAGHYADALPLFQLALNYHVKTRGEHFSMSREGYNNVANTLAFLGREPEAIALGLKTLALERADLGPDHPDTIWFENNLANFYERDHDLATAEATYRDVLARARRVFTKGEWDIGHFAWHLGVVLAAEGKTAEARSVLGESVKILTTALGKDSPRAKRARAALDSLNMPTR
ncbi:MAG TPA: tetratricopeptide repeat protein [Rhizomicrobium sp.]|nr:tetratricopeptide repeat protein [Rhizomicrobium sp.]